MVQKPILFIFKLDAFTVYYLLMACPTIYNPQKLQRHETLYLFVTFSAFTPQRFACAQQKDVRGVRVGVRVPLIFRRFAKFQNATINFVMSVGPSIRMEQFGSHWTNFYEIRYEHFFENMYTKFKFNTGYFTGRPMYISDIKR